MRSSYITFNGVTPTTGALVPVATGATIKTLLQILPTAPLRVIEWGISFDGSAAATPIRVELIHTTTVAATVVAHVAAGVQPFNDPNLAAAPVTLGVSATGYTASAEGTVTGNTRLGDLQLIAPTNQYVKQFPLGEEFQVPANGILRVRVTATATVNAYCYVVFNA
jgi:uncharacterized protein YaiE (UPF0345 family)